MDNRNKSDEQLMLEYASGSFIAFEELFGRYNLRLYNLFLRSLNKTDLAQDLLQECFLRVILARKRYQPKTNFSKWIFTIAMNLIRDKYREQREVIILSKYEGFSFAKIARILNTSPEAAKQKAYRGMQALKKKLAYLEKG